MASQTNFKRRLKELNEQYSRLHKQLNFAQNKEEILSEMEKIDQERINLADQHKISVS